MVAAVSVNTTEANVFSVFTSKAAGANLTKTYALVAYQVPSVGVNTSSTDALVAIKTIGGNVVVSDAFAFAVISTGAEERNLRAWTFTQDDHDFYVLQVAALTYVFDTSTQAWSQWKNGDATYFRGIDGTDWQGINVCIDPDTGKLFKIDPDNRLDYSTTPIVSQIFGGMSERFRNLTPCYMAEVAVSQARPPAGIDATTVGIQLRSYDGIQWVDHGTIQGQPVGNRLYARYYGLGLMQSPFILFEITDTGYARRIDGLNVEMAGTPDGQTN